MQLLRVMLLSYFCRVLLRKQIHKKTIIRGNKEETVVTEHTQIEKDFDGPEELRQSVQEVLQQFMDGSEEQ